MKKVQLAAAVLGGLFVLVAAVVELDVLFYHRTTHALTVGGVTTTTVDPAPPSDAVISAVFVAGVVVLVIAVFADRIRTLSFAGVEIDLAASVAGKAAAAAKGDADRAEAIFREAYAQLQPPRRTAQTPNVDAAVAAAAARL